MAQAFDGIASDVEHLSEQIRELERRVSTLENRAASSTPALEVFDASSSAPVKSASLTPQRSRTPETWRGFPEANVSSGALPVIGKAVLAIAGAYLLRAVAESGVVPKLPLLMVAIVYAGMWLVWAERTHATNQFASVTYAITSALILSPLLWESTVRFQILWPSFTAAVLVAFVVLALALAWRQDLQAIPWVATLAAVATGLALIVATRELVPFTAGLLAIALATEAAVCLGRRVTMRVVPAIAADLAVWLLVYLMTSPEGVPPDYPAVNASTITVLCLALLAIYGGSIGVRCFGLRHEITIFEIAQGVVAFVLAAFGTLRASPQAAPALGGFFLLMALACYWGTLSRFLGDAHHRNRRVCATYAVALLLAGCLLLFPVDFQAPFLCVAAVTSAFLYVRTGKLTLGMHVSLYLAAAAILSGLLNFVGNAMAGSVPSTLGAVGWVGTGSAGFCYAIGLRALTDRQVGDRHSDDQGAERLRPRLLWVVPLLLVAGVLAALAVMLIAKLGAADGLLKASHLSVARTMVICLIALLLGFSGARWKRAELVWVAYVAIALGTLKLLFEDLRFGNAASLVASLLFYGLILIVIPRLTRLGRESA